MSGGGVATFAADAARYGWRQQQAGDGNCKYAEHDGGAHPGRRCVQCGAKGSTAYGADDAPPITERAAMTIILRPEVGTGSVMKFAPVVPCNSYIAQRSAPGLSESPALPQQPSVNVGNAMLPATGSFLSMRVTDAP